MVLLPSNCFLWPHCYGTHIHTTYLIIFSISFRHLYPYWLNDVVLLISWLGYFIQAFITQDPDDRDLLFGKLKLFNVPIINHVGNESSHEVSFQVTREVFNCVELELCLNDSSSVYLCILLLSKTDENAWYQVQARPSIWCSCCCQRSFNQPICTGPFCMCSLNLIFQFLWWCLESWVCFWQLLK